MFSKLTELAGFALVACGVGLMLGTGAALVCGGLALVLVGGTTDDVAVKASLKRSVGWARYLWHRQIARENGVLEGSPHPPIEVDPETEEMAQRLVAQRLRRGDGRIREAMP